MRDRFAGAQGLECSAKQLGYLIVKVTYYLYEWKAIVLLVKGANFTFETAQIPERIVT